MTLKKRIKKYLYDIVTRTGTENIVTNINLNLVKEQKKILIAYLDLNLSGKNVLQSDDNINSGTRHTNRFELFQIIQAFIQLDFCIDVCSHSDIAAYSLIDSQKYDVIFGLGEVFRYASQHSNAFKIIYMTENPYYRSFQEESKRIQYFFERHNKKVNLFRTGMVFKENDEQLADAILCVGEVKYYENLQKKVVRNYPSAFRNGQNIDISKRSKNNFLVLGTDGFIHKGIDLLCEVFAKHPEWNLYVCGHNIQSEAKEYGLKLTNNIIDCGYVDVQKESFASLAEKCMFILLPSCSEGMSTAVMTGMRHGMLPIVTSGNGFDELDSYCYFFKDFSLETIEETICETQVIQDKELYEKQEAIMQFANDNFSLEHFSSGVIEALQLLLSKVDD